VSTQGMLSSLQSALHKKHGRPEAKCSKCRLLEKYSRSPRKAHKTPRRPPAKGFPARSASGECGGHGSPLEFVDGCVPSKSALKLHANSCQALWMVSRPAALHNVCFCNAISNQCFGDGVPSQRSDVQEYASTPLLQDFPTPTTGTPSPCTVKGMQLFRHPGVDTIG
jgi:hypothetical protein